MSSLDKPRRPAPIAPKDGTQPTRRKRREVGRSRSGTLGGATESGSLGPAFRHHWILWVGPVVMLLAALLPWPYGYYNLLRFCVCGAAAFLAYQQWTHDNAASKWVVMLVAIAFLYNPLVPIHLTREIWTVLNVGTAMALIAHFRSLRLLLDEPVEHTPLIGARSGRSPVLRGRPRARRLDR